MTVQTKAVPLHVLVTSEQKEFLERKSASLGISQARLIREATFGADDSVLVDKAAQLCESSKIASCVSPARASRADG